MSVERSPKWVSTLSEEQLAVMRQLEFGVEVGTGKLLFGGDLPDDFPPDVEADDADEADEADDDTDSVTEAREQFRRALRDTPVPSSDEIDPALSWTAPE